VQRLVSGMIQGTFDTIQGTSGMVQGTFDTIQGTSGMIQGTFDTRGKRTCGRQSDRPMGYNFPLV
jgi:hypothetical protein